MMTLDGSNAAAGRSAAGLGKETCQKTRQMELINFTEFCENKILILMENTSKRNFFVKLIYFISRVFFCPGLF